MDHAFEGRARRDPWNKGKLVGQRVPLRLKDIWAIRVRLQLAERTRELAKASLIYRRTKVQLLLGHTKLESTVRYRYLGIEVDDALEMAEQTEV
jgi:hypothetical protein